MSEPIQPGRQLGTCPECGEDLRREGMRLYCRGCPWSCTQGQTETELTGKDTQDQVEVVVAALCEKGIVVRHAGGVWLTSQAGLLDLSGEDATRQMASRVVCRSGHNREPVPSELAKKVVAQLREDSRVPKCRLVTPNTVLYQNAEGLLVPTSRGLSGPGILQTGPDIEPANTGLWTEFLENTTFVEPRDRETFEAWCLAAVVPMEYLLAPMILIHATEQNAGKTWLLRSLAWAMGYRCPKPLRVMNGRLGDDFDRRLVGAVKGSRFIEIDNVTGSDDTPFEDNRLSDALTKTELSCGALYRVGTETVENRVLIGMTMNLGRIVEDLAVRTISVRLSFDPEDSRVRARARRGETFWMRPEVGRTVLSEILWRAQRGWAERAAQVSEAVKYQEYFNLVKRLTGREVPPCHDELRFGGLIGAEDLRAILRDKEWQTTELCRHIVACPEGTVPPDLRIAAIQGPAALGRLFAALRRMGRPLTSRHTMRGWCWKIKQ